MDPVVSLNRTLPVDYSLCIFCQTHQASVPLSQATDRGLAIVRNTADSRKKLRDTKNIDVIDRRENVFGSDMPETLVWHVLYEGLCNHGICVYSASQLIKRHG